MEITILTSRDGKGYTDWFWTDQSQVQRCDTSMAQSLLLREQKNILRKFVSWIAQADQWNTRPDSWSMNSYSSWNQLKI